MASYNSYHSNLIILHRFNALPAKYKSIIPKSTLSTWKKQHCKKLIGADEFSDTDIKVYGQLIQDERFKKSIKALYHLCSVLSEILRQADNKKKLLKSHKNKITKLVAYTNDTLGTKRTLRWLSLSAATWQYWLDRPDCSQSYINLCKPRHCSQLTTLEVSIMKEYLSNPQFAHWSTSSIYYQSMNDQKMGLSLSTWYKYAYKIGRPKHLFRKSKLMKQGIRAKKTKQILHIDVTVIKTTDQRKLYLHLLVDNYSRKIIHWKLEPFCNSQTTRILLEEAINCNSYVNSALISDGGPENFGAAKKVIMETGLSHLIAQTDIPYSNSMVEAVNKQLKKYYLYHQPIRDLEHGTQLLSHIIDDYNNKPHGALYGMTPDEVWSGKIPNKHRYESLKKLARDKRLEINRNTKCCLKT